MYTRWCNTVCNSNMLEKFFLPMPPPSAPPWREHLIAYLSNYVAAGDEWRLRSLQLLSFSGRGGGRELERGGPREDGTPNPAGAFFFFTANGGGNLSFLCVYEWWYVRGFLLVLRASFRGLTGAQWWNCGKMWEGGGGGEKFGLFQGDEGGWGREWLRWIYISLRDNRSRVSSRNCCEGSTYRSKLWLKDKFELRFIVEREKKRGNIVVR